MSRPTRRPAAVPASKRPKPRTMPIIGAQAVAAYTASEHTRAGHTQGMTPSAAGMRPGTEAQGGLPHAGTDVSPGRSPAAQQPTAGPISLVLVDDNRLLREGIAGLIRGLPDFHVLAASADVEEAMRKVRQAKPRVVLLDFGLENGDSLRATSTVHQEVPEAKVIVMGLLAAQEDVAEFVRAGASGFIMKDASFEEFIDTIRKVAAGGKVLPAELAVSLFSQIVEAKFGRPRAKVLEAVRLTSREREVVDLISEGLSNKEISTRMNIAVHTVKSHVHNVLEKLALHSRLEVAAFTRPYERVGGTMVPQKDPIPG